MAVYVTDTHPLIWFASGKHRKLSASALRAFERANRGEALIWVPPMALLEVGMLEKAGRVRFNSSFAHWAEALLAQPGFALAKMDAPVIFAATAVSANSDPFDISIMATAQSLDLQLITKDRAITDSSEVQILW